MENLREAKTTAAIAKQGGGGIRSGCSSVVVELPLGAAAVTFDLEKAVCSHGLFMMAPNYWEPLSKTLLRPIRVDSDGDYCNGDSVSSSSPSSLLVRISQPSDSPSALHVRVYGTDSLSPLHQKSLLAQVRRMLRLSEAEETTVKEFQKMHEGAKERGFGRVFRSPTLFEDMVKCILLCNCQWSRTLSMARALCELQLELQCESTILFVSEADNGKNSRNSTAETFSPRTPSGKESKRKRGAEKGSTNLDDLKMDSVEMSDCLQRVKNLCSDMSPTNDGNDCHKHCSSYQTWTGNDRSGSAEIYELDSCLISGCQSSEEMEFFSWKRTGNFPSPGELANLDEKFLAKRCKLGYRASRILNLAKSVVVGKIQLRQLEEACSEPGLSNYDILSEQLQEIDGFGSFTSANVLMCMGFYHVIPTDSETIRHLKKVHKRNSSIQTVQRDVEAIYGKYAPFQFLAYWSEVWNFYEEWFGKLSEMPHCNYKLITAANMRPRKTGKRSRTKIS